MSNAQVRLKQRPMGMTDASTWDIVCGTVIESKHPDYKEGDFVVGNMGVQQYAVSDGQFCYKTDTFGLPKEKFLGVLGMPGFTAGFDACIDYKNDIVKDGLKTHCPKGIDVYFDNVGGDILDDCLAKLNFKGRVSLCGAISGYNSTTGPQPPKNYLSLLINSGRMEGFIVFNYRDKYMEAAQQLGQWMLAGKLKSKETVIEGINTFPDTFNRLFSGDKLGKLVLKP